jgi:site-specific recombinase XerD
VSAPPARQTAPRTLIDILPSYLDDLNSEGKAAHTVASTRLDLQQLARFLGRLTLDAVTPDDLRAFFGWLGRQQGNRTSSLRRKTATVKGLFRQLHARGELEHDPAAELLYPPLVTSESAPMCEDEIEAIVQAAASSVSWRALILSLTDAGLKRDEVVALRREDVELLEPPDRADGSGRLHVRHRRAAKRVKQRTLGLTARLAESLADQLAAGEAASLETVFDLSARGVDFIVETCGRRAGVRPDSKITPKQLRDAFACARIRTFQAREAEVLGDPATQRELRREHDALLIRELGLARASIVPERYRRMVSGLEGDRPEQG